MGKPACQHFASVKSCRFRPDSALATPERMAERDVAERKRSLHRYQAPDRWCDCLPPTADLTGWQFNVLILARHKPVFKTLLEPACSRRLSGRNGVQFVDTACAVKIQLCRGDRPDFWSTVGASARVELQQNCASRGLLVSLPSRGRTNGV